MNNNFINKFQSWLEKYLIPISSKISNQKHLAAIRDGMTIMIPLTIIGGFAILLAVPPVPAGMKATNFFYSFLLAWQGWANQYSSILMIPYQLSIGIISIYVVAGVSYRLAKSYQMDGISNMIIALFTYICISGSLDLANGCLLIEPLGASYMFSAMMIGLLTVEINRQFIKHNLTIKMPKQVPPNVAAPFNVLIPSIFNIILFLLLDILCTNVTGQGLNKLIFTIIQPLLSATGSLPSVLLIALLIQIFWFFGIHGDNMVGIVTNPITTMALTANMQAYAANEPLPYIYAGYAGMLFGAWITMNAIQIVMLKWCHSAQLKSLVKVSIIPNIFNINEPTVFGMPTILNVYLFFAQLIGAIFNYTVYYILASLNIVGRIFVSLPFTTPGPIMAFLTTMDIKALILWIVLFIINILFCIPLVRMYDKQLVKQEASQEVENEI